MTDLTRLTAAALAEKIHSREVSAVEVAQAHLDRIAAVDAGVHAFLHVATDAALQSAGREPSADARNHLRATLQRGGNRRIRPSGTGGTAAALRRIRA